VTQLSRKDRYGKRLRIGVRFDGTKLLLLDGSVLPKLKKDAVAELLMDPNLIEDENARMMFTRDSVAQILGNGSLLFVGVSPHLIGDQKAEGLRGNCHEMGLLTDYWLVEVRLYEALNIRIRGDQEARLEKCRCFVPALSREASSINHAFTVVSEAYETKRLSHIPITDRLVNRVNRPVISAPRSHKWR
jgi:hypothetical protein